MSITQTGYLGSLTKAEETTLELLRKSLLPTELQEYALEAEDYNLWGACLSNLDTVYGIREKVILLKFLRARDFVIPTTMEMILNTLKWRKAFRIHDLLTETFPPAFDALGYIYGTDKLGQPVTYNFYGAIDTSQIFEQHDGIHKFVRWRVQLQEKAIELLDFENGKENITQVHDYEGASLMRMSQHMKAASKEIINLFSDNYPEFLYKKLFVNVPFLMQKIFSVLSVVIPARTFSKFTMVSAEKVRSTLLEIIEPTNFPAKFGGFSVDNKPITTATMKKMHLDPREKQTIDLTTSVNNKKITVKFICDCGNIRVVGGQHSEVKKEYGDVIVAADEEGKASVIFDNQFSYWNGKNVFYVVDC